MLDEIPDSKLAAMSAIELAGAKGLRIRLDMPPADALAILSLLQLALRHPQVHEFGDAVVRACQVGDQLTQAIGQLGPATAEVVRIGWSSPERERREEPRSPTGGEMETKPRPPLAV